VKSESSRDEADTEDAAINGFNAWNGLSSVIPGRSKLKVFRERLFGRTDWCGMNECPGLNAFSLLQDVIDEIW
jgi:hypothetical protein